MVVVFTAPDREIARLDISLLDHAFREAASSGLWSVHFENRRALPSRRLFQKAVVGDATGSPWQAVDVAGPSSLYTVKPAFTQPLAMLSRQFQGKPKGTPIGPEFKDQLGRWAAAWARESRPLELAMGDVAEVAWWA